jgi:hypothetical protein
VPEHANLTDFSEVINNVWVLEIDQTEVLTAKAYGINSQLIDELQINAIN